ncbi:phage tail protein [Enterobacterales bacterium CwR94]|nr:phage tail protein [Enterobacterales bacterium CwR94]
MATDTFTWCVRIDANSTENISVLSARFGDGYKQVATNGINASVETWNLSCTGTVEEMKIIRAFLRAHVVSSFWWVNPWGDRQLYRVKPDSIAASFPTGQLSDLSFVFEQAYAP